MIKTIQILTEKVHSDIVNYYEWTGIIMPNILIEKDFNKYGLVEINLPKPGDVIPSSFPDWLKGHLQSYLDSPPVKEPRDIDHIPSHDELETIIMNWNDFWEWIPRIKMSLEELEQLAQEANWISIPLWRKAIQL